MSVSFLRHSGWFAPEMAKEPITIIGVGATGSHAALMAAKMGFRRFDIWDADIVESHNLPNQAYDNEHLGMPKVEALKAVLTRFNPEVQVTTHNEFFKAEHVGTVKGDLLLLTDTMSSRKEIGSALKLEALDGFMFETRLGFKHGELNITPMLDLQRMNAWLATLKSDDEIPAGPCNLTICTTLVMVAASTLVHSLCNHYIAKAKGETWNPSPKTIFQLDRQLDVYTME